FLPSSLIDACAIAIDKHLLVSKGKLIYTKATVNVNTGGVSLNEAQNEYEEINQPTNSVPDIISYLHKETQLTRKSIVEILRKCEKINYFKINPQKFIEGCVTLIKEQMRKHIVDGIVYHKMGDSDFYSQQLFEENTLEGYLKRNMQESTKSPYNYIKFDSNIESNLAKGFEQTANVKVYAKLPSWFFIDTPLGNYNPDWAVLVEQNGTDKLFFVIESKGSLSAEMLRDLEKNKIECGKRHFEELSDKLGNAIALQVVSTVEDFSVLL
ncbi:MAG: type III restriction endonuclease subunit R, partial [Chitinophagia bacterium]|nr:type III restriction endonuclease subunit R [Chitinophagia bacterium]